MTYPTPPGPRIAYDEDGSQGFIAGRNGGIGVVEAVPLWLQYLNADSGRYARVPFANWAVSNVPHQDAWIAIRLATPTHLQAVAFAGAWQAQVGSGSYASLLFGVIETSQDSTTGEDGTWATLINYPSGSDLDFSLGNSERSPDSMFGSVTPLGDTVTSWSVGTYAVFEQYRQENDGPGTRGWREVSGSATRHVRWVRFRVLGETDASSTTGFGNEGGGFKLHLYGVPDDTASLQRLEFDTTAGAPKTSFDWGDIGIGEVHTQQFKMRNLASAETAEGVTITVLPTNPAVTEAPHSWLELSLDGTFWDTSIELGDLAPGALSDTVTLRVTAGTSIVGPWAPRLIAEVGEWV